MIDPSKRVKEIVRDDYAESEFSGFRLMPGVTRLFANKDKQVKSLTSSLDRHDDGEVTFVFGKIDGGKFESEPVSICDAFIWCEAFFFVPMDDEYAKAIYDSQMKKLEQRLLDTKRCYEEGKVGYNAVLHAQNRTLGPKPFSPKGLRGDLLDGYDLSGITETAVPGHFEIGYCT
jgi:hypothetical protein